MNNLYSDIISRKEKIAVVGLGYVGLPLAAAFSEKADVIGFDIDDKKVEKYREGIDVTGEVGDQRLRELKILFTSSEADLEMAKFIIIAVPTPVLKDKTPDLRPLKGASGIAGRRLQKGSVIVYESTVYPGVTEEICIPVLEKESGLKCGNDFKVGYSPERINPGDRLHSIESITKVVSGMDAETLDIVAQMYSLIIKAGVYRAENIKTAEAAKVIENSQRDINIAFVNELSVIFNKIGLDTSEVLKAAATKWNFIKFHPGLVGGHCIGVDPYYLTYKAELAGYHPEVILSGRRINDSMGKYVAENTVKQLIKADRQIKGARVLLMGITFKENVPDIRNSRVIDIIRELIEYGVEVFVSDHTAEKGEVKEIYGIDLIDMNKMYKFDAVVIAVAHDEYRERSLEELKEYYVNCRPVLIDVKGIYDRKKAEELNYCYWRL